jgi:hypothetical protein
MGSAFGRATSCKAQRTQRYRLRFVPNPQLTVRRPQRPYFDGCGYLHGVGPRDIPDIGRYRLASRSAPGTTAVAGRTRRQAAGDVAVEYEVSGICSNERGAEVGVDNASEERAITGGKIGFGRRARRRSVTWSR